MTEFDDYTKPSRVKRRLKRRWRKKTAQRLTVYRALPDNRLAAGHMPAVGREKPFSLGVKAPHSLLAAFLCPSFRQALCRAYSVMAGCPGQRSALAAPKRGFLTTIATRRHAVRSMTGGYSILSLGLPA